MRSHKSITELDWCASLNWCGLIKRSRGGAEARRETYLDRSCCAIPNFRALATIPRSRIANRLITRHALFSAQSNANPPSIENNSPPVKEVSAKLEEGNSKHTEIRNSSGALLSRPKQLSRSKPLPLNKLFEFCVNKQALQEAISVREGGLLRSSSAGRSGPDNSSPRDRSDYARIRMPL